MDPRRRTRQRAGGRAQRVEATVDRTAGGAACPVGVREPADERVNASWPAFDPPNSAHPEATADEREQP